MYSYVAYTVRGPTGTAHTVPPGDLCLPSPLYPSSIDGYARARVRMLRPTDLDAHTYLGICVGMLRAEMRYYLSSRPLSAIGLADFGLWGGSAARSQMYCIVLYCTVRCPCADSTFLPASSCAATAAAAAAHSGVTKSRPSNTRDCVSHVARRTVVWRVCRLRGLGRLARHGPRHVSYHRSRLCK